MARVLATKTDDLGLSRDTHMVKVENRLPEVVLRSQHMHGGMCTHKCTHTHIKKLNGIFLKQLYICFSVFKYEWSLGKRALPQRSR